MQRTNGQHYVVKHVHRLLIAVTFLGCKDCVARVVRRRNLTYACYSTPWVSLAVC